MWEQQPDGSLTWFDAEDIAQDEDNPWLQVWSPSGHHLLFQTAVARRNPLPETAALAADPDFERGGAPPSRSSEPPSRSSEPKPRTPQPLPGIDTSLAMSEPAVAAEERPMSIPVPEAPPRAAASFEAPAPAPAAESTSPVPAGTPIPAGLSPDDQSKHEKARRLARVLASDIAIYNREKRDRGIREGNLVAMLSTSRV